MTSFLLGHCPGHFLFIYLFLNHFWATISRAHYSFQRKVILKLHQVKGNDILFSVMPYRHVEEYARYQGDERRAQLTSLFKTGELEELFMFWTVKIIGKVGLIVIFLEVWYSFWWNIWHPDSISSGTHIPVNWIWDACFRSTELVFGQNSSSDPFSFLPCGPTCLSKVPWKKTTQSQQCSNLTQALVTWIKILQEWNVCLCDCRSMKRRYKHPKQQHNSSNPN